LEALICRPLKRRNDRSVTSIIYFIERTLAVLIRDRELGVLGSFWIWDLGKQKWLFIRNWEEHKREAMKKFDEYM